MKTFILVSGFQKNQIFSLFAIVKMNANYAEIYRVGNLGGRFSTSYACSIILKFSQYCCETSIIQIQQIKVKNIFLEKKNPKNHFIEIAQVRPALGRKFNFRVNI